MDNTIQFTFQLTENFYLHWLLIQGTQSLCISFNNVHLTSIAYSAKTSLSEINYTFFICTTMCDFTEPFWLNPFPHMWQENGFSPVWILICRSSFEGAPKDFQQTLHEYLLSSKSEMKEKKQHLFNI